MRPKYETWRTANLALLNSVDQRVAKTVEVVHSLVLASAQLAVSTPVADNVILLSQVHKTLRSILRPMYLREANAMVYVGASLLSSKLNAAGLVHFDEVGQKVATAMHTTEPPVFSPLAATFKPDSICPVVSPQSFDDQLGVTTKAAFQGSAANVLLVYDVAAQGGSWLVKPARRGLVCEDAVGGSIDPVARRAAEDEVNKYLDGLQDTNLDSPFPSLARKGISVTSAGELVSGSLISLCTVDCSVEGFEPKPIVPMSPDAYQLPQDMNVALVLSAGACERLIASVLDEYEHAPENNGFFNAAWFHKWVNKNVTLCLGPADHCTPERDALNFGVPFGAKYEATTLGKDWNVDISGVIPVHCTFATFYRTNAAGKSELVIQANVAQSGPINITGNDLHAGFVGEVIKHTIQPIVDAKIADIAKDLPRLSASNEFLKFENAQGSPPFVAGNALIIELAFRDASQSRQQGGLGNIFRYALRG